MIGGSGYGGVATLSSDTALRVSDCAFVGNKSTIGSGGGIYCSGQLRVTNTLFERNEAPPASSDGGGIFLYGSTGNVVANCTFTGNKAGRNGGGIAVYSAEVSVTGTTLTNNQATSGGGISLHKFLGADPSVTLDSGATISGNAASSVGGGVARMAGTFNRNDATISGNTAGTWQTNNCYPPTACT